MSEDRLRFWEPQTIGVKALHGPNKFTHWKISKDPNAMINIQRVTKIKTTISFKNIERRWNFTSFRYFRLQAVQVFLAQTCHSLTWAPELITGHFRAGSSIPKVGRRRAAGAPEFGIENAGSLRCSMGAWCFCIFLWWSCSWLMVFGCLKACFLDCLLWCFFDGFWWCLPFQQ